MTTAQILKRLQSAKSEQEMLAIAAELGVTQSFFNIGSTVTVKTGENLPTGTRNQPSKRRASKISLRKKKVAEQVKVSPVQV